MENETLYELNLEQTTTTTILREQTTTGSMFDLKKSNAQDIFQRHLVPLYVIFGLLVLNGRALVSATGRIRPSHQDFAISELTAAQKEKFLDEHNKFRGMVDPPAADMEYLVSILSFSYLGN